VRITIAGEAAAFAAIAAGAGADDVTVAGNVLTCALQDLEAGTPAIVRALVTAGAPILSVRSDDRPLEEVYLALVGDDSAGERAS
jgi:hypothetical protein